MPDIFDGSASTEHHDQEQGHRTDYQTSAHSVAAEDQQCRHVDEYSDVMRRESPTHSPFVAFAPKPVSTTFDTQGKGEHVLLLLRQHPVTQIPWVLIAIGMVFIPFFLELAFPFVEMLPGGFQVAALLGWYGLLFSFVLQSFLMWFFNVYIITDERVIDVDFHSLIYKNISAAKLDNIEDITATTGGAIRSVFDYGTIKIQTAAATTEFEFEDVPHPAKVTSFLNELLLEEEREKIEGRVS